MRVWELGELGVILRIRNATRSDAPGVVVGIGDDCAVLALPQSARLLATTDFLLEDIHFRRRYAEPADIGWKALARNLSDVAAMGGTPRFALVALACPSETEAEEIDAFYRGIEAAAAPHGVVVVGGDTSASPDGWIVNVTLLGEVVGAPRLRSGARPGDLIAVTGTLGDTSASPDGWIVNVTLLGEVVAPRLRSGARPGDLIAVTGTLGESAAGLALLEAATDPGSLDSSIREVVRRAHLRPVARVAEGRWLGASPAVSAMIDLSDGLATDLGHLASESRAGARVHLDRLPISPGVRSVARALGRDPIELAVTGGEDYELLLTVDPAAVPGLAEGLRAATGTPLTVIGEAVAVADGIRFVNARGEPQKLGEGFEHFARPRRTA